MSTVVIKRSARRPAPEIPAGELAVEPPPEIPQSTGGRWQQAMMALPMLGGSVAMAMMMGRGGGPLSYVVGGLFGVSSLAMLATSFGSSGSPKKSEMMAARREYLRHLSGLRRRVRETATAQRVGLFYRHPDPAQLWSTAGSHRVWERRPADPDFGVVRLAVGPQTLATPLVPPVTRPLEDLEPMTAGALRRFLDAYSVVPSLPVAVSVRGFARVFVRGEAADTQALTRADADPDGGVPRARRPDHRGLRGVRPPGAVGVGQVAAAHPAPVPDRRPGPGPAGREFRVRVGEAARGRDRQPAPVQPGRREHQWPARGDRARRRRPQGRHPARRRHRRSDGARPGRGSRRGCWTGRCWSCRSPGASSTRTPWNTRPRSARRTG